MIVVKLIFKLFLNYVLIKKYLYYFKVFMIIQTIIIYLEFINHSFHFHVPLDFSKASFLVIKFHLLNTYVIFLNYSFPCLVIQYLTSIFDSLLKSE